jgi:hypothetical protein
MRVKQGQECAKTADGEHDGFTLRHGETRSLSAFALSENVVFAGGRTSVRPQ